MIPFASWFACRCFEFLRHQPRRREPSSRARPVVILQRYPLSYPHPSSLPTMRRSVRTPDVLDLNISGDEEEQHRIQLEHNLQNTELSLRLSSLDDNESIEYPRHYSGRTSPEFSYMQNKSYDDAGPHAWSYRTGDDEEGLNPYVGQHTVSTAAHHASAVTLSAGLYGRRGRGAEVSISGAEYDPERPIQNIIAGVDSKLSMFDLDPSRSRYNVCHFNFLMGA